MRVAMALASRNRYGVFVRRIGGHGIRAGSGSAFAWLADGRPAAVQRSAVNRRRSGWVMSNAEAGAGCIGCEAGGDSADGVGIDCTGAACSGVPCCRVCTRGAGPRLNSPKTPLSSILSRLTVISGLDVDWASLGTTLLCA